VARLAAAVAAVVAVLGTGCSGDDGRSTAGTGHPMDHAGAASDDGACSDFYNASFMHWNPSYADQLATMGCPWPYPPGSVPTGGGQVDPSLDAAAFEPSAYQDVWDALTAARFGVCAVERIPPADVEGFVYGFRFQTRSGGCAGGEPDSSLALFEMATRAQRDAAAHASSAPEALVLGRWVVEADGAAAAGVASVAETLGAIPVPS
jgi:hypothetical protein